MAMLRWSCIVAVISLVAVSGLAQTSMPATKPLPPAADVLGQVPSGVMAVLVVKDVRQTTDKIDKFLSDAGVAPLLRQQMPKGALETLKTATMMGQGFNPDGGFAVAMMDPAAYHIDLAEMLSPASAPASAPTTSPADKRLPFVIYVPGNDIESVFSNYKITQAGKYSQVALRMGMVFAAKSNGYVVLSLRQEALDDALAATHKLATDLDAQQNEVLKDSAFAIYFNMKIGAPLVDKLLDNLQSKMAQQAARGGMAGFPIAGAYKELVAQVQTVVLAGKIEPTGLLFDVSTAFDPNSLMGKQLGQYHGTGGSFVDRLPNLQYFIAAGAEVRTSKEAEENTTKSINQLLATDMFKNLSDETKGRITALAIDLGRQITSFQFEMGGLPEGASGFGGAAVLECKDSEGLKMLLAKAAETVQETVHSLAGEDENLKSLTVTYKKDAEKSGDVSVDVIEVNSPSIEKNAEDLSKSFGEKAMQFRVAAMDKNLVVASFGGGEAMLAAAMKNARGGGSIPADPGTVEAMKYMPASRICVELFHFGNLFSIIQKSQENGGMLPINLQSKTPIALGIGVIGSSERASVYIPTDLVKDVAGIASMFLMPGGEGPGATSRPSEF